MTDEELQAIEQRAEAASQGPWTLFGAGNACVYADSEGSIVASCGLCVGRPRDGRNAEFIAHARADVPALLGEIRRLREDNERMTQNAVAAERERIAAALEKWSPSTASYVRKGCP